MKIRLLKEHNGKAAGKVGVYLSDYAIDLIAQGIAEQLEDDFVVEQMPKKEVVEQPQPIYIPVPVPMNYFQDEDEANEDIIKSKKNK